MKRAINTIILMGLLAVLAAPFGLVHNGAFVTVAPHVALAAEPAPPAAPEAPAPPGIQDDPAPAGCAKGQVKIALPIIGSSHCVDNGADGGAIIVYLKAILKLLSGAVGGVIVLMLVVAGIQYITSAGDPTAVKSAKNRIMNAIMALVLFLMMFAILNFIIPGGILTA